mgnify:CR=1 FL=1
MPEHRPPCLEVRGLTGYYGETQALHGMEFVVHPGEVVCLLGRNGAGKTTLMEALLGLRDAQAGEVSLFGLPAARLDDAARARIGYVPQQGALFEELRAEGLPVLDAFLNGNGTALAATGTGAGAGPLSSSSAHATPIRWGGAATGPRTSIPAQATYIAVVLAR